MHWITFLRYTHSLKLHSLLAIKRYTNAIYQYISLDLQSTFIKCRVISGSPGCGKSFLMNYIILYAISKVPKVGVSAMLACRAIHLGDLQHHKKCLPVKNNASIHCLCELAITEIIGEPKNHRILRRLTSSLKNVSQWKIMHTSIALPY